MCVVVQAKKERRKKWERDHVAIALCRTGDRQSGGGVGFSARNVVERAQRGPILLSRLSCACVKEVAQQEAR